MGTLKLLSNIFCSFKIRTPMRVNSKGSVCVLTSRTAPLATCLRGKAFPTARMSPYREDRDPGTKLRLRGKMLPNALYCPSQFLGTR